MKKVLLLAIFFLSFFSHAQIKTAYSIKKEIVTLPYDSLHNKLDKSKLEQYIGQTLYLPKTEYEKENGFYGFKKNIKGKVYKPLKGANYRKTDYKAVAGKYFEVIGVERETKAYINDVYLHLRDKDTGDELYFDNKVISGFPFIVQGYYEKTRSIMIGRTFYFLDGTKKCVDYYIEEGSTSFEMLRFDDNTTRWLNNSFLAESKAYETVYKQIKEEKEIEKKYGKLRLGIDETTCSLICGSPLTKNISEGSWGIHEQWVYDDKYIYLENGIVTSIQYKK